MNFTLTNAVIFAVGAAVGSFVTWRFVKEKYARIANEEIESVKNAFNKKINECPELAKKAYDDVLNRNNYNTESKKEEKNEEVSNMPQPYVIPPEEFGEMDDYETISLTYYSDEVLADDAGNIIEDVDFIVGFESLYHFGEYEDDSVFVRNDELKCDYEILLDSSKFYEGE